MQKSPTYCKTCPYALRHGVKYVNVYKNDLMILSDYPYDKDLQTNSIFSGKEKYLMDTLLDHVGLKSKDIFFANSCRCKLDKKRDSTKAQNSALTHCREILKLAIKEVEPKVIITLGRFALRQMLSKQKIMENRGKIFRSEEFNCNIFVTVHPNYCLNGAQVNYPKIPIESMTSRERLIFKDFELIKSFIVNNYELKDLDISGYKKVKDISLNDSKYVAIDSETTGLDLFDKSVKPLCWGFSYKEGESEVIIHE